MPRIFITYRRADSRLVANRIYDRLVAAFGERDVFKDVNAIPPGRDFRGVLREATTQCRVMLVVIGPNWVSASDAQGNRRLDDPNDFTRIEVETGLQREGILVIPLLVEGATMPRPDQMPDSLRELAYNNAFVIHDDPLFHQDMDTLIHNLPITPQTRSRFPLWLVGVVALLLIIAVVVVVSYLLNSRVSLQNITVASISIPNDTNTHVVPTDTLPSSNTPPPISNTPEPSATATLSGAEFELTITADYAAILDEIRQTQDAASTTVAIALTATADTWTDTPTPDARKTAEARVTRDAMATMTILTATADAWTDTPTPTTILFQARVASSFFGANLRSEPSISQSSFIKNISSSDSLSKHIEVYAMVNVGDRSWYLVFVRDGDTLITGYIDISTLELIPPSDNPNATPRLITLTPTPTPTPTPRP